jgi:hypothetical protein
VARIMNGRAWKRNRTTRQEETVRAKVETVRTKQSVCPYLMDATVFVGNYFTKIVLVVSLRDSLLFFTPCRLVLFFWIKV